MWFRYSERKLVELFAMESDLGLHCLPITSLGVSSLQWDKTKSNKLNFSMAYAIEKFNLLLLVLSHCRLETPKLGI